jgi:hypothetical protein
MFAWQYVHIMFISSPDTFLTERTVQISAKIKPWEKNVEVKYFRYEQVSRNILYFKFWEPLC